MNGQEKNFFKSCIDALKKCFDAEGDYVETICQPQDKHLHTSNTTHNLSIAPRKCNLMDQLYSKALHFDPDLSIDMWSNDRYTCMVKALINEACIGGYQISCIP